MQCPVCKTVNLVMSERQGIEIDYCPQCRGVWLDRGELDKIIERSASLDQTPQWPAPSAPPAQQHGSHHQHPHQQQPHPGYYKKKKRESFFEDLFDF